MATWRDKASSRDITVYEGEDLDLAFALRDPATNAPWTPPDGTTAFWRVFTDPVQDIAGTIVGSTGSVHIEHTVSDLWPNRRSFWFFVQTPDTADGNPKLVTEGVVQRRDPKRG